MLSDPTLDVFLVLDTNNEFETGSLGEPPLLSFEVPLVPGALRSRSYIAFQGSGFFLTGFNWSMEMRFLPPAGATNVVIGRP